MVTAGQKFCYQHQTCADSVQVTESKKTLIKLKKIKSPKPLQPQPQPQPQPSQPKPKPLQPQPQPKPQPQLQPRTDSSKVIGHLQDPQPFELTKIRLDETAGRCAICWNYVNVRESLRPERDYPKYLQDRNHIMTTCDNCYKECMNQCVGVMGKGNEINCRTLMCSKEYKAMNYAQIDKKRLDDEHRTKLAGVKATMAKMGIETHTLAWPSVPKNNPI
jgi:hypothetical protein